MKKNQLLPWCVGTVQTRSGLKALSRPSSLADMIEIRLDALLNDGATLEQLLRCLSARRVPVLLTLRITDEGGVRAWKKGERLRWLELLLPYVDAIDVERASLKELKEGVQYARSLALGVVCSAHFIAKNPGLKTLKKEVDALLKVDADIAKIAVRMDHVEHLRETVGLLLQQEMGRFAMMGLGTMAPLSRQVLGALGSRLMYGYVDRPAAPGQPSIKQIRSCVEMYKPKSA